MIRNKFETKQAVDYVKYPLAGKRGVGLNRAQKYGTAFDSYKNGLRTKSLLLLRLNTLMLLII